MKLTLKLKPTEKQKEEQIKKRDAFLQTSEIKFLHFNSDGKITEITDLKNINFIENDTNKKM